MGRILDLVFDVILFVVVEQVLARAISKIFGGGAVRFSRPGFGPRREEKREPLRGEAVRDPVCGMFVSKELAHQFEWRGEYFCSKECLEKYRSAGKA
ncbi:MAG: hypothetical protein ACRD1I_02255 [Terriglobia bacterium]